MKTKTNHDLQRDVMEELSWKLPLEAAEIGVSVNDGIVTLSGVIDSYSKKREAERIAENIEGVKAIVEKIEVRLPGSNIRTDEDIAKAARNTLHWNVNVPDDKIKLIVNQGWVNLEGEVEWGYQKTKAEDAVESLTGVKGVTNLIRIKSKAKPFEVTEQIKSSFRRNAMIDAERIQVEVEESKVILKGKVRSLAEKKDAERAAWLAPNVSHVDNQLEVYFEVPVS